MIQIRDGQFDLVIAAGPRLEVWPSIGVRTLSITATEMGLSVGMFGGSSVHVQGAIPLSEGSGALVLIEDVQKRIHRITTRALVRVSAASELPDPFLGSSCEGLIPLSTAKKIRSIVGPEFWYPGCVLLGTGNRALRFGSELLELGIPSVICLETVAQWGAKRFAGWEVEKRRFEMLGGKLVEGRPLELKPTSAMRWNFKWQDLGGVTSVEVGRVVSCGPFQMASTVREYPSGSLLFEMDQIAAEDRDSDFEGWVLEQERGRWLASKIVKALVPDLGEKRDALSNLFSRAKSRLKRYGKHRDEPFEPVYEGKWMSPQDTKNLRAFQGVPKSFHKSQPVASVECIEEIPCTICQTVCPENAIERGRVLHETRCTGCGACLTACPSQSIVMLHEPTQKSQASVFMPVSQGLFKEGDFVTLVNRRGQELSLSRVLTQKDGILQVEVPPHLLWEARGVKRHLRPEEDPQLYLSDPEFFDGKVEVMLNNERRFVKEGIPVSLALFSTGKSRPEDVLSCGDGSCRRCYIKVDGITKLACATDIHRGVSVVSQNTPLKQQEIDYLCPCLGISKQEVVEKLKQGNLHSPEAVIAVTHVGEGSCHGQICMSALKRLLEEEGFDLTQWVDWRFPWMDWTVT